MPAKRQRRDAANLWITCGLLLDRMYVPGMFPDSEADDYRHIDAYASAGFDNISIDTWAQCVSGRHVLSCAMEVSRWSQSPVFFTAEHAALCWQVVLGVTCIPCPWKKPVRISTALGPCLL